MERRQRLVDIVEVPLLDPRLNVVLNGEFEHFSNLLGATDVGTGDASAVHDKRESGDLQRGGDDADDAEDTGGGEEGEVVADGEAFRV